MKIVFVLLLALSSLLHAETLMIASGAGYKRPVSALARDYEAASGNKVEEFYGNMAQVIAQTRQSERVGLIVGDLAFLQNAKEIHFTGFVPLGAGKLVLAYAKGKSMQTPLTLADADYKRIAIPDSRNAIYGKAAEEFLETSGLAARVKDKLLMVATVPQVSAYLVSGEVDAGFINITDVMGIHDKIGGYLDIDPKSYTPIKIVGGIVEGWETKTEAKAFIDYLKTAPARNILEKNGL